MFVRLLYMCIHTSQVKSDRLVLIRVEGKRKTGLKLCIALVYILHTRQIFYHLKCIHHESYVVTYLTPLKDQSSI